jgi:hypothetical protein
MIVPIDIEDFCDKFYQMTHMEIVDFVDNYGEHKFFVDLVDIAWHDFYVKISLVYHCAKQYFIEH